MNEQERERGARVEGRREVRKQGRRAIDIHFRDFDQQGQLKSAICPDSPQSSNIHPMCNKTY